MEKRIFMMNRARTGLVWFRGSLRLRDNTALYHALRENETLRACYVLDDTYMRGADIGAARGHFLLETLAELAAEIARHGGQLIVRRVAGNVPDEVLRIAESVGAGRIYINRDYLPYPMARDAKTAELAQAAGMELKAYDDVLLVDPATVLTENETPYTVFSPFKRRWEGRLNTPKRYAVEPELGKFAQTGTFEATPIPTLADYGLTLTQNIAKGGEASAYARLDEFRRLGMENYHQNRDNASDPNSSSQLSMHIKWGTVSIRDCYRTARDMGGPGPAKWIDELAWREFYYAVVYHFPHVLTGPMLPEYAAFPWNDNAEQLEAWKTGNTGYPFVDAGMRQLNATGWMHNRLRQVTASYLCKDLLINWQEGERYFMQQLTCGDWPPNNGGWQWVAGCGTDPRRATRIFNPTLQMERYDPNAEYVRQWVPEFGTSQYPKPIVPHEVGRVAFMERFGSTSAGRQAIRDARKEEELRGKPKARRGGKNDRSDRSLFE